MSNPTSDFMNHDCSWYPRCCLSHAAVLITVLLTACAPKVTAETQPPFVAENFLDGTIARWPSMMGPGVSSNNVKRKAANDLRAFNYVGRTVNFVLNDFSELGIDCKVLQGGNICKYCSTKMEIIPQKLNVGNDLFIGAYYWEIMLIPETYTTSDEKDIVHNMQLRMGSWVRFGLPDVSRSSDIPHDYWSLDKRRQICDNARASLLKNKPPLQWQEWEMVY